MTLDPAGHEEPLLEIRHLSRGFDVRRGLFQAPAGRVLAVDDVSLSVMRGETLGLVGESGCGKSTLARLILRLVPPDGGDILFRGRSLLGGDVPPEVSRRLQMVFQDPFSSLNPRLKAGVSIGEPLRAAGGSPEETRQRVADMLEQVGLLPEHATRYPHEFSGGQRQRIAIARAVILHPDFIVCDEAVSALDASVQAQVLNLLKDMQQRYGFAYLFISHDLAVVGHMSDRVAVMYLGRIVEIAPRDRLFGSPAHPYTRALLDASPRREPGQRPHVSLGGDLPSPLDPPSGCAFHPRCPLAAKVCRRARPALQPFFPGHLVACHLVTAAGQPADLQR